MYEPNDFDDLGADPMEADVAVSAPAVVNAETIEAQYWKACGRCGGTGIVRPWGTCYRCMGRKGTFTKTSPEKLAKQREQARDRKQAKEQAERDAKLAAFVAAQPAIHAWLVAKAPGFDFAASLLSSVRQWGRLTDGQMAAVARLMERDAERAKAQPQAPEAVGVSRIEEAFEKARSAGLKRLSLRIAGYVFKPAPAHGKNPGAIYVTAGGQYLGKVAAGRLQLLREFREEDEKPVLEIIADPAAAAKAHGIKTGECSICGQELTNPVSVERGIGPICAGKYGF